MNVWSSSMVPAVIPAVNGTHLWPRVLFVTTRVIDSTSVPSVVNYTKAFSNM